MNRHIQLDNVIDVKRLGREQERQIFSAIHGGDKQLRDKLLASCMSYAGTIAKDCASSAISFEELFYEARTALFESVKIFNCNGKERFFTFMKRQVEERMQDCYNKLAWFLPIDYRTVQLHDRFLQVLKKIYPDSEDREDFKVYHEGYVADCLGVTVEELRAAISEYESCKIVSLNDRVLLDDPTLSAEDREVELIELIADSSTDSGAADYLDDLMDCLTDEERYVVCSRTGVLSVSERTDRQIAKELGLNSDDIENIYQTAVDKIRKARN